MELNLELRRLLLFVGLLGAFAFFGGFIPPDVPEGYHDLIRVNKGWRNAVVLFLAGAVSVALIDHSVGTLDRTNLRVLYVILGLGLMLLGVILVHSVRESLSRTVPGFASGQAGERIYALYASQP